MSMMIRRHRRPQPEKKAVVEPAKKAKPEKPVEEEKQVSAAKRGRPPKQDKE